MKWTEKTLMDECESADKLRDSVLESLKDRLERYYGQGYGYTDGQYWPENYYYAWVARVLPEIVFQNPRVKLGSMRSSEILPELKALELGMNRYIKETDQRVVLRRLGFDLGFAYGVSFTTVEPYGNEDERPWRPCVKRLDQRLFSMDPLSSDQYDARYQQHVSIEDRDQMLEWVKDRPDEEWSKKAIEQAGECDPTDLTKRDSAEMKGVPNRGQIAYRNIWVPEVNDYRPKDANPEDYNGTIYTLALYPSSDKELVWLRPPHAAFCPKWGPYTIYGAHTVPNCPYPLGPLVAMDAQFMELNALALANYKSGRRRKRIGLFDETMQGIAQNIIACEDGGTVGVPGFEKANWVETELGGVTETGLVQEEHARQMAERGIGINDVQRGQVGTGSTATEVLQAAAATNIRTADLAEQFAAAVKKQYATVAWYMWKFEKVSVPLSKDDVQAYRQSLLERGVPPEALQQVLPEGAEMRWTGEGNKESFDSLELDIEPYSMKRTDEPLMQQRAMQALEIATNIGPAVIQNPHIRFKLILDKLGDAMNWPGFSDILDEQAASQLQALFLQGQQVQQQEPSSKPQPRLTGDLPSKPPAQGFPKPAGAPKPPQPAKVGAQ